MLFVPPAQRDGGDDDKCSQENEEDEGEDGDEGEDVDEGEEGEDGDEGEEGEDGEDEMNTDTMSKHSHSLAFTNGLRWGYFNAWLLCLFT